MKIMFRAVIILCAASCRLIHSSSAKPALTEESLPVGTHDVFVPPEFPLGKSTHIAPWSWQRVMGTIGDRSLFHIDLIYPRVCCGHERAATTSAE